MVKSVRSFQDSESDSEVGEIGKKPVYERKLKVQNIVKVIDNSLNLVDLTKSDSNSDFEEASQPKKIKLNSSTPEIKRNLKFNKPLKFNMARVVHGVLESGTHIIRKSEFLSRASLRSALGRL